MVNHGGRVRARVRRFAMPALGLIFLALLGVPASQSVDVGGGITNVAPTLSSVTIGASFDPTAGTTTSIPVTIIVSDANGCNDISSVTGTVYLNDGTTVHIASASATRTACVALLATYSYAPNMQFYDAAATYKVKVLATDAAGATVDNTVSLASFTYNTLTAVNLASATLAFGSLAPGASGTGQTESVQNYGNVQIDAQISGTDLTLTSPSATIGVANVKWSLSSDMSSSTAMSTTAATISSFDLAKGASSSKSIYVQLVAPSGSAQYVPAGTYSGTVTVTAVSG